MAAAHSPSLAAHEQLSAPGTGTPAGMAIEQTLIPSSHASQEGQGIVLTPQLSRLPVEMDVSVPVQGFRVRNLLALEPSQLVESGWGHDEDVPLAAGQVQLAWSEFEVIDTAMAVRVTRLA